MKQLRKVYVMSALALTTCGVLFQNCAAAPPPDLSQFSLSSVTPSDKTCGFGGVVLTEGQSVSAFQSPSVAAGTSCVPQTRTCSGGTLSGTYSFGSCFVESPSATASCNFLNNSVLHGQSIRTFQSSSVSSGSSCAFQDRVCTNGNLSGTYSYTSCVVDCAFNGAVVGHGGSVLAFAAPSVPNGSSCASQQRSCSMGVLSGSYAFGSCSEQPATPIATASCNFNGQTILHGASVTAYQTDIAPYGTTCLAYDEVRVCNNGILSGSHIYPSCEREYLDACGEPVSGQYNYQDRVQCQ